MSKTPAPYLATSAVSGMAAGTIVFGALVLLGMSMPVAGVPGAIIGIWLAVALARAFR